MVADSDRVTGPGRAVGGAKWAWPFRVSMTVAAVMLCLQPVYAGEFLSGSYSALQSHNDNADYAAIAVLVAAVCAVVLRWPGGGPRWPLLASVVLFGLTAAQIVTGHARVLAAHVPLGVAIVAVAVALAVWSWRGVSGAAAEGQS